jgi:hypothetical protein
VPPDVPPPGQGPGQNTARPETYCAADWDTKILNNEGQGSSGMYIPSINASKSAIPVETLRLVLSLSVADVYQPAIMGSGLRGQTILPCAMDSNLERIAAMSGRPRPGPELSGCEAVGFLPARTLDLSASQ